MRIVLVEDNPADVRLFRKALRFYKITADVNHFGDGLTAVAALRSNSEAWTPWPDIVFLDLNMPRLDGFAVLSILRETTASTDIPVVVFTSSQAPADIERAASLKCNRVLRKPTNVRSFFEAVSTTIQELVPPA